MYEKHNEEIALPILKEKFRPLYIDRVHLRLIKILNLKLCSKTHLIIRIFGNCIKQSVRYNFNSYFISLAATTTQHTFKHFDDQT